MHSFIMSPPVGFIIDHKDHNGLNNQRSNLRICTYEQNQYNRKKCRKKCSSIYKGIYWHKRDKKWIAKIRVNNERICIGYFNDEIEAARAYDIKAKELFREFACPNFV